MLQPQTWMTVQEAAESLGVTDSRVRQMLIAGELIGEKFGKSWAVTRKAVVDFGKKDRPRGNPNFLKNSG